MGWRAPVKRPTGQSLRPQIPETCEQLGPATVRRTEDETAIVETTEIRCNPPDMLGAVVRVDGFEDSNVTVVVRIARRNGDVHHAILDSGTPELTIVAQIEESHSFFEYLMLGVGHLLTGWDHLTFVLGLLVLFGWHRRLIAAVTAFTVGHSLTLALSVLGIVSFPTALVEASIALTIVVLALEIQSGKQGPVWKHPWILPGALGLLHGLGFASVLFDAGLPERGDPARTPGLQPRPRSRTARGDRRCLVELHSRTFGDSTNLAKQPNHSGLRHWLARRVLVHRTNVRGLWNRRLEALLLHGTQVRAKLGRCLRLVERRKRRLR